MSNACQSDWSVMTAHLTFAPSEAEPPVAFLDILMKTHSPVLTRMLRIVAPLGDIETFVVSRLIKSTMSSSLHSNQNPFRVDKDHMLPPLVDVSNYLETLSAFTTPKPNCLAFHVSLINLNSIKICVIVKHFYVSKFSRKSTPLAIVSQYFRISLLEATMILSRE